MDTCHVNAYLVGCGYAVCACLRYGRFLRLLPVQGMIALGMTLLLTERRLWEKRRLLRMTGTVWICSLLLGGTGFGVMALLGRGGFGLPPALLTALIGTAAVLFLAARQNAQPVRAAEVEITSGGTRVSFSAAVDTGNTLTEPVSGLPVIVVERKALCGTVPKSGLRCVPYATVSGGGRLYAFLPERVRVNGREVSACVAACDAKLKIEGHGLIPGRCLP